MKIFLSHRFATSLPTLLDINRKSNTIMYLLNINTMRLERVGSTDSAPEYAILSHTWSQDIDNPELVFADWNEESQKSARAAVAGDFREMLPSGSAMWKLVGFCKLARALSLDYVWIDTLCIDQRASHSCLTFISKLT